MSIQKYLSYLALIFVMSMALSACSSTNSKDSRRSQNQKNKSSMTIAFGSCNHHWESPQPMWSQVLNNRPDLWIWLGDIIYTDTEDMSKMKNDYDTQKAQPDYRKLAARTDIIGIWDDHDYGINNGGKEFVKKDSSKLMLFDFLDIPPNDTARTHTGAYQSYEYTNGELLVKVILLDVRYFRDSIGSKGSIIGNQQWQWLINELTKSKADVNVIGGGTQFLAEDHKYEKWANFPVDRQRLIQIIDMLNVSHPILLSGDRHLAEMALIELPQSGNPLLEITSSGLTHAYTSFTSEENRHRVGPVIPELNFGMLKIEKKGGNIYFDAEIRDKEDMIIYNLKSQSLKRELAVLKSGS